MMNENPQWIAVSTSSLDRPATHRALALHRADSGEHTGAGGTPEAGGEEDDADPAVEKPVAVMSPIPHPAAVLRLVEGRSSAVTSTNAPVSTPGPVSMSPAAVSTPPAPVPTTRSAERPTPATSAAPVPGPSFAQRPMPAAPVPGRAPSPVPQDQSAQVRAVSWLILRFKRQWLSCLRRHSQTLRTEHTEAQRTDRQKNTQEERLWKGLSCKTRPFKFI